LKVLKKLEIKTEFRPILEINKPKKYQLNQSQPKKTKPQPKVPEKANPKLFPVLCKFSSRKELLSENLTTS